MPISKEPDNFTKLDIAIINIVLALKNETCESTITSMTTDLKELLKHYFRTNRTGLSKKSIDAIDVVSKKELQYLTTYVVTLNDFQLVQYEISLIAFGIEG